MTYDEAKRKILIKRLCGTAIVVISSISSAISALKMFYFGLDNGDQLSGIITQQIKQLVYLIYENTHFLEYFWTNSPTPTPKDIFSGANVTSFAIYLCIFLGMGLTGSARALSGRLAEIENELIRDSIRANTPRRCQEIQEHISILKPGWFSKFHTLYLAPIIVGLVVAVVAKLTGLV